MNIHRCPTCGTACDVDAEEKPDGSVTSLAELERDRLLKVVRKVAALKHSKEEAIDIAITDAIAALNRIEAGNG
jgi:hypothetical protein